MSNALEKSSRIRQKNDQEDSEMSEKEKYTEKSDTSRSNDNEEEEEDDQVDSKTLKCQFQSMQAELKRRIEALESILLRRSRT
ncbi:unnamed protein product [Acanthoscelides obtectus]|uniref:Uncharacterized protein n=1 Tax=Acanthoscelides obtectus TaxID=200917 RepID=A0A9P0PZ86_ACAOB|nr:unnamed protein product [Acanthoscelides obtectus]CAK1684700.1 hypothetical protein AOBTE_LOCUS35046 [Acanthoscelides obtectus]